MNYKGLSARERKLIDEIERRSLIIFKPLEASKILNEDRENTYRILSRLESKEAIKRIEKGKYILKRFYEQKDIYEIAPHLLEPSYISFWSGLHFYGYTTQVPRKVFLVVTRSRKSLKVRGLILKFVKVKEELFFGYRKANQIVVAEPEKLFIDCLMFPKYCGGVGEIKRSLKEAEIETEKIIHYAIKTGNKTLCSRLGYLLEEGNYKFDKEKLKEYISRSYVLLDPSSPSKSLKTSSEWNLKINLKC